MCLLMEVKSMVFPVGGQRVGFPAEAKLQTGGEP